MTVTTTFICIGSRAPAVLYSYERRRGGGAGRRSGAGRRPSCNVDGYNCRRGGGTLDRGRRTPARHTPWHRSKIFPKIKPDLS